VKKARIVRLGALVAVVLFLSGCGLFAPVPVIKGVASNVDSTTSGSEIYVTVSGGTIGNGTSAFQDYTAEVALIGAGVTGGSAIVEDEFTVTLPARIESSGSTSVTARLTDSTGEEVFSSTSVNVFASVPNEGTQSNPLRLVTNSAYRTTEIGTAGGSYDESYYQFTAPSSSVTIRLRNASFTPNQYLYRTSSFSNQHSATFSVQSWTTSGLTPSATYYLLIRNISGFSEEFEIRVESN